MKLNQKLIILLIVVVVLVLIFSSRMFYVLKPGERGVIFQTLTGSLNKEIVLEPGLKMISPWNEMIRYNVREQKIEETMDVLDKNGLSINVDVSVRFNPIYNRIGYLHEIFGKNYINQIVIPEVRSSVRKVTGRYTAEEIYSTKRNEVEAAIINETAVVLRENNILMTALLIRSINLPEQIKQAIENKLKQEQEALAYQFRLEKEKSEAERKRIEAEGISNYNRIITRSLSDNILRQRGIDATLEMSKSPNTKVIVIGSGKEGLPLILGNN